MQPQPVGHFPTPANHRMLAPQSYSHPGMPGSSGGTVAMQAMPQPQQFNQRPDPIPSGYPAHALPGNIHSRQLVSSNQVNNPAVVSTSEPSSQIINGQPSEIPQYPSMGFPNQQIYNMQMPSETLQQNISDQSNNNNLANTTVYSTSQFINNQQVSAPNLPNSNSTVRMESPGQFMMQSNMKPMQMTAPNFSGNYQNNNQALNHPQQNVLPGHFSTESAVNTSHPVQGQTFSVQGSAEGGGQPQWIPSPSQATNQCGTGDNIAYVPRPVLPTTSDVNSDQVPLVQGNYQNAAAVNHPLPVVQTPNMQSLPTPTYQPINQQQQVRPAMQAQTQMPPNQYPMGIVQHHQNSTFDGVPVNLDNAGQPKFPKNQQMPFVGAPGPQGMPPGQQVLQGAQFQLNSNSCGGVPVRMMQPGVQKPMMNTVQNQFYPAMENPVRTAVNQGATPTARIDNKNVQFPPHGGNIMVENQIRMHEPGNPNTSLMPAAMPRSNVDHTMQMRRPGNQALNPNWSATARPPMAANMPMRMGYPAPRIPSQGQQVVPPRMEDHSRMMVPGPQQTDQSAVRFPPQPSFGPKSGMTPVGMTQSVGQPRGQDVLPRIVNDPRLSNVNVIPTNPNMVPRFVQQQGVQFPNPSNNFPPAAQGVGPAPVPPGYPPPPQANLHGQRPRADLPLPGQPVPRPALSAPRLPGAGYFPENSSTAQLQNISQSLGQPNTAVMPQSGMVGVSLAFNIPPAAASKPGLPFIQTTGAGPVMMPQGMMMAGAGPAIIKKVLVPWGWKRICINNVIVYFSPSGIQLRSLNEVKDYLMTQGTCKCGLECPLKIENTFDFNPQKISEVVAPPTSASLGSAQSCKHIGNTVTLAQLHANTGLTIRHQHNPVLQTKDGKKKKLKKKKPFSGVLVSDMLAAREAEKNRINEIIAREKAEHEAKIKEGQQGKASEPDINVKDGTDKQGLLLGQSQHPISEHQLVTQPQQMYTTTPQPFPTNLQPTTGGQVGLAQPPMQSGQMVMNQSFPQVAQAPQTQPPVGHLVPAGQPQALNPPFPQSSPSTFQPMQHLQSQPPRHQMYPLPTSQTVAAGQVPGPRPSLHHPTGPSTAQFSGHPVRHGMLLNQRHSMSQAPAVRINQGQGLQPYGHQVGSGHLANTPHNAGLPLASSAQALGTARNDVTEGQYQAQDTASTEDNKAQLTYNSIEPQVNISEAIPTTVLQTSMTDQTEDPGIERIENLQEEVDVKIDFGKELVKEEEDHEDGLIESNLVEDAQPEVKSEAEDSPENPNEDCSTPEPKLEKEEISTPSRPNNLPGMIPPSGLMSLSSAANIFRGESRVSSKNSSRRSSVDSTPYTPQTSSDGPRAYSLADAMAAARRLNLEQERRESSQPPDSPPLAMEDAEDAVEEEAANEDDATVAEDLKDSLEDEKSDLAKNIEIRRLSSTEEGNKVLEPTFHSPEKEKKKNPLENILNFVSGIELPKEEKDGSRNSSPSLSGKGSPGLPNLKSRKSRQYTALPPLPHSPPSWAVRGQGMPNLPLAVPVDPTRLPRPPMLENQAFVQPAQLVPQQSPMIRPPISGPQMILAAPTFQIQGPAPIQPSIQQPQVMQLIQTVNGPVLVPIGSQPVFADNSAQAPAPDPGLQVSPMSSNSSSPSSAQSSPKDKSRKRKATMERPPAAPVNPVPILMSPNGGIVNFQPASQAGQPLVAISQSGTGIIPSPQVIPSNFVLNQGNQQVILQNGALMAVQQPPQGIIYQQLPDGTLLQVQQQIPLIQQPQQLPLIQQPGQQLITAPIVVNNQAPLVGNSQQFVMTPQGLVQAISPVQSQGVVTQSSPTQAKRLKESKKKSGGKKKVKKDRAKTPDMSVEETDEQDGLNTSTAEDMDTSSDDVLPSTSGKHFSPRSSIQSNKVDSSGLNATPPHQREGEFEQLRDNKSPADSGFGFDESKSPLDRGFDLDSSAEQMRLSDSLEKGSEGEEEEEEESELVSSSMKKKRKRNADDMVTEQINLEEEDELFSPPSPPKEPREFQEGDIVWGPVQGHPSWPGKVVELGEEGNLLVCWYGGRHISQVNSSLLKNLSEGLEAHHKERKKIRKGRKMNGQLEKAIQEAMMELD